MAANDGDRTYDGGSDFLNLPLYTFADADHLAFTSHGTAKRWLAGYQYRGSRGELTKRPPVTPRPDGESIEGVSFLDLVELVAIGRLKGLGFTLHNIREIVDNCRKVIGVERPLTALKFRTDGREIFVSEKNTLVEVLHKRGRTAWEEVLAPFLDTLDYQDEVARKWWPLGKRTPILVDPNYGFGFPVIGGSGVRTDIILERFQAADEREQIAKDFNVQLEEVDAALRFEMSRLKRAA